MSPLLLLLVIGQAGGSLGEQRARLPQAEGEIEQILFPVGKATPRLTVVTGKDDSEEVIAEDFSHGRRLLWRAKLIEGTLPHPSGTLEGYFQKTIRIRPRKLATENTEALKLFRAATPFAVYNPGWYYYGVAFDEGRRFEGHFALEDSDTKAVLSQIQSGKALPITMSERFLMTGESFDTPRTRRLVAERQAFFGMEGGPTLTVGEVSMAGPLTLFPVGRADLCYAMGNGPDGTSLAMCFHKKKGRAKIAWKVKLQSLEKKSPNAGTLLQALGSHKPVGKVPAAAQSALNSKAFLVSEIVSAMAEQKHYGVTSAGLPGEGAYLDYLNGKIPTAPISLAELWLTRKSR